MKDFFINAGILCLIPACTLLPKEDTKPNIIIIYADDVGYGDPGVYGATQIPTPELDKLANEGAMFTSAYCMASTCTPSRYSLLTGKYAFRNPDAQILPPEAGMILEPGSGTMAEVFRDAGYRTGVIGKWHLGIGDGNTDWNREISPSPLDVDFDLSFVIPSTNDRVPTVWLDGNRVHNWNENDDPLRISNNRRIGNLPTGRSHPELLRYPADEYHSGTIVNSLGRIGFMDGGQSAWWDDEMLGIEILKRSQQFIKDSQKEPFFLFMPLHHNHTPRVPHPMFIGKSEIGLRGDHVVEIDYIVGETINLPGSMTSNNKGFDVGLDTEFIGNFWPLRHNPDYKWYEDKNYEPYLNDDEFLFPFWLISDKHYLGRAWYQKEIDIPDSWEGKQIELVLERCHWETQVWLNDMDLGTQNSLGIPHRYELTEMVKPGRHTISIAVDNRVKDIYVGSDAHSISDNTQTSWNGIIGNIKLVQRDRVSISHVSIFPDVENKQAILDIEIKNISGDSRPGNLKVQAKGIGSPSPHIVNPLTKNTEITEGVSVISISYPMGEDMLLWDEFNPNLYELAVELTTGPYHDKVQERFGMRDFSISGTNFTINGRPIFLRGTLECAIFPKTGYPPTDVESWERILRICRDHGLNHLRFHSWCPPKAAFIAADNMGFYYQVEASSWTDVGYGQPIDQWLYEETKRMIREYGNHPSFVMMSHGNEPHGTNRIEYLAEYLNYFKAFDTRRLYTAGAGWPIIPESDYHNSANRARIQTWAEELNSVVNNQRPRTNFDWSAVGSRYDKPLVSHEIGQWCVYPNFKEIEKYDGVMKPTNFHIFKRSLEANHMIHLSDQFLMASGKLQAKLYKADLINHLESRPMARQLRNSLVNYMTETAFDPMHQISIADLQKIKNK